MNAFVTLATNDDYALGALVLCQSLRQVQTKHQVACMISKQVSSNLVQLLEKHFDCIELVDVLDSSDSLNLSLLKRPELGITFTKLHCWRLTQYSKAVFMDADTVVLKNIDDLLLREEFSAAPDPGWPDCFNSGVFVYTPSLEKYSELVAFSSSNGSFDGGDQGLLNSYFNDWSTKDIKRHLPFTDNCMSVAFYSYFPAFVNFHNKIRVVHFIGSKKPWHYSIDSYGRVCDDANVGVKEYLNFWWSIFINEIKPQLNPNMAGLCGELARCAVQRVDFSPINFYPARSSVEHQRDWERGSIDYTGTDRFEVIQKKLDEAMGE